MKHAGFVHLHLHTKYSLLDGAIRPEALFERAREFKMPAVAMTDHGNMFGAVEFYQKAAKYGIKPLIGSEVYVAPGSRHDRTPPKRGVSTEASSYHLVLLVKNDVGYRNLCKLLSLAYTEGFYYRPRVDKELLAEYNEGLIALSACLHGEVAHNLSIGDRDGAVEAATELAGIFPDRRFFLELQKNGIPIQEKVNDELIKLAGELKLPLVATNDCHYLRKEESRFHDALLCIQTGKLISDEHRMRFATDEFYFKSPDEMIEAFGHVPDAISNTIEIAERCNLELRLGEPHLPEFHLPEGVGLDAYLDKAAADGLEDRLEVIAKAPGFEEGDKWQYHERLKKELNVIKKMGFPGYFLIVADFIQHARDRGIPVGPGRGSAAGSLVAFSLGITNLDPIRYNLLFERFLNPDRISLPDIDIDFCIEERDEVIKYVTDKYGAEKVSQIITFGQMKARAVIRDVGRVMDMPYGDVDRIAKLVPDRLDITVKKALAEEPKLSKLAKDDKQVGELIETALALEGLPRHASTHAAGVVISNKPLDEYLPLYRHKDGTVTTQYPMADVESIGLVKFDFLGLKNLTVIDRALKSINAAEKVLDLDTLPLDDADTYKLVASGNTNGIFQLESSGIKELLRKLKPEIFEELIAAVALYRPGPLQSGMAERFIKRKHGEEAINYDVPQLEGILSNTYGVMVYQEQVMEIAKVLAGFTPGDADVLRKAMGKKVQEVMLEQRQKFLDGAKANKVPKRKSEIIFDQMAKFAEYGFNKSHSAAYALIAYQTAYLKTHHPVEFMSALISANMGDTDKVMKYMAECKEMEIQVLPPDLNESAMDFNVVKGAIRFGLGAVKNVGDAAIEAVIKVREEGPFTSLLDFLSRVDSRKANKRVVESLIKCGALDFAAESADEERTLTRSRHIASMDLAMEMAQGVQRDREIGQANIFDVIGGGSAGGGGAAAAPEAVKAGSFTEWTETELLTFEKDTLGFYISSHPLKGREEELGHYTTDTTESASRRRSDDEVSIGGVVVEARETTTKKGARMAFLRLEDLAGTMEVVVFSKLYSTASEVINSERPVVVTGRVEKDAGRRGEGEQSKLIASDIFLLDDAGEKKPRKTHIHAPAGSLETETMEGLKQVLKAHPGPSPVFLHLDCPEGEVVVGLPDDLKIDPAKETLEEVKRLISGTEIKFS